MLKRLDFLKKWSLFGRKRPVCNMSDAFRNQYDHFKALLDSNAELSKMIADIEDRCLGQQIFGMSYVRSQSARAVFHTLRMIKSLNALSGSKYLNLFTALDRINDRIKEALDTRKENTITDWILPYSRIGRDMIDWVGGKNANLGEVLNQASLPIPEGFAITTRAFDYFLSANDLVDEINKAKMELDPDQPESIHQVSESIQKLLITAPVPSELKEAILDAYDRMQERLEEQGEAGRSGAVSLRSSAIGEDSELSYAGQYLSVLNVPRDRIIQTYNYIVASLFTPRAIAYRLSKGVRDEDIAMSVACLQMVDSVASGIVYSRHPFNLLEDHIIINAVWGLGPYAVDGVITPDTYLVAKDEALTIREIKVAPKPVQLRSNPDGGLQEVALASEQQNAPCLSPEQMRTLAEYALKLEHHYGGPQDMEWALDRNNRLLVLQTRPLHLEAIARSSSEQDTATLGHYRLLVEGGSVSFPGIGFGPAFQVHSEEDLLNFPDGAVLVAKHSSPKFVVVMPKAQAIVTDSGSVTGHMASLTRELRVPSILSAKTATASIPTGMEVTVDAYSGRVYQGKVPELLKLQTVRSAGIKDTPVYRTLKQVAEAIAPLTLIDPKSPKFAPEHCQSLHDIMRFVHERSYAEMFQISDLVSNGGGCAVKLDAPIPLDLFAIDLGGGLAGAEGRKRITVGQVVSAPFKALLKGMLHKDLRFLRPRPIDLGGFFSVMSEQMFSPQHSAAERFGDRSYAIVSDKYLNFSSRVGYHYSILDAYCGQTVNKNYITFSFKGGAADEVRRNRRVRAIAAILNSLDFTVDVMGDRVDARFQKYEAPVIEEKLDSLGRLLLFTRQMDMLMHSEATVGALARAFLEGDYHLESLASLSSSEGTDPPPQMREPR